MVKANFILTMQATLNPLEKILVNPAQLDFLGLGGVFSGLPSFNPANPAINTKEANEDFTWCILGKDFI